MAASCHSQLRKLTDTEKSFLSTHVQDGIKSSAKLLEMLKEDAIRRKVAVPLVTKQDVRNFKYQQRPQREFGLTEIEVVIYKYYHTLAKLTI